ncbi:putative translation factor GUF1 -like protein, mitochondrial-like isoform X1 [Capsicum annuum]|nr:putative translation factor GUF1 -like protein, mitochondrial-like isoform X1 [Capsicum annuum]
MLSQHPRIDPKLKGEATAWMFRGRGQTLIDFQPLLPASTYGIPGFGVHSSSMESPYNLGSLKSYGVSYTTYQLMDVTRDWWRSFTSYRPLGLPIMTETQGFMTIVEYEAHFHNLSEYSSACIAIEYEKIKKFEKGFDGTYQLATAQTKIPPGFRDYKNGKLPKKVSLRDRLGNMWPIGVTKIGREISFQYGWPKFIKDNKLENEDFLIFGYEENRIFSFKLLGTKRCEKKEDGGLKLGVMDEKKEMNVDHQKSIEPKEKNWASDSSSSSFSDGSDKDFLENEDMDYDQNKKVPCSKCKDVQEEKDDEDEEKFEKEEEDKEETKKATYSKCRHEEEVEYTDCNDDNEERRRREKKLRRRRRRRRRREKKLRRRKRMGGLENLTIRINFLDSAGWKRATARKVSDLHDIFGTDIFKRGHTTQPKNPYFVAKVQPKRKNQLYVLADVVRDYKLEFPSTMSIRDFAGREFKMKVVN